jgi:predicted nucleic acid-binding protein
MIVVLDASVALAWMINQAQTPRAIALRKRDVTNEATIIVPSLFTAEVCSGLLKFVARKEITSQYAYQTIEAILFEIADEVRPPPLGVAAVRSARRAEAIGASYYDNQYIDLALELRTELWTVDERCRAAALRAGVNAPTAE